LAYLGFAPLFLGLGATTGSAGMTALGLWFTSADGIIITSIVNAALSLLLLVSGFKNYVKFQYLMWYATLLAFVLMLYVLLSTDPQSFAAKINAFVVASGGADGCRQPAKSLYRTSQDPGHHISGRFHYVFGSCVYGNRSSHDHAGVRARQNRHGLERLGFQLGVCDISSARRLDGGSLWSQVDPGRGAGVVVRFHCGDGGLG